MVDVQITPLVIISKEKKHWRKVSKMENKRTTDFRDDIKIFQNSFSLVIESILF